jgi:ATP-dependent helicase HrpA
VEWAVPGLRTEQVTALLQSLPKSLRRLLMPFPPKVEEIVRELRPTGHSLAADLGKFIHQKFGVEIPASTWRMETVPSHLRPRIEIATSSLKPVAAGRDLDQLRQQLPKAKAVPTQVSPAWQRAARQWERFGRTGWTFGDLPDRVLVGEEAGLPAYAWLGLQAEEDTVSVRIFRGAEAAKQSSLGGLRRLLEIALQKDLAWLQKDLRALSKFDALYAGIGLGDELQETAFRHLKGWALPSTPPAELTAAQFETALASTRERLRGLAPKLVDRIGAILQLRLQIVARAGNKPAPTPKRSQTLSDFSQLGQPAPKMPDGPSLIRDELDRLLPSRFLERIPYDQLPHLPRYLKALLTRAERAALNPAKDQERTRQLAPFVDALRKLENTPPRSSEGKALATEFRWMVEEFKVSLFAQELGTSIPVSPKRLEQMLERVRQES